MRTRPSLSIQSELSVQLSRADRERPLLRCVAIQAYTLWNGTNVRERKIHTRSAGFFYINGTYIHTQVEILFIKEKNHNDGFFLLAYV